MSQIIRLLAQNKRTAVLALVLSLLLIGLVAAAYLVERKKKKAPDHGRVTGA